jgi:hypothetical protein
MIREGVTGESKISARVIRRHLIDHSSRQQTRKLVILICHRPLILGL